MNTITIGETLGGITKENTGVILSIDILADYAILRSYSSLN
jgi:hypothetical protein